MTHWVVGSRCGSTDHREGQPIPTQPSRLYLWATPPVSQPTANISRPTLSPRGRSSPPSALRRPRPSRSRLRAGGGRRGNGSRQLAYDSQGRTGYVQEQLLGRSCLPRAPISCRLTESQIPSETVTEYDGAGRDDFEHHPESLGAERCRTTVAYSGVDRVDATPPSGGTPPHDLGRAGQKVKLVQYLSPIRPRCRDNRDNVVRYDAGPADRDDRSRRQPVDLGRLTSRSSISATDLTPGPQRHGYDTRGKSSHRRPMPRRNTIAYRMTHLDRKTGQSYQGHQRKRTTRRRGPTTPSRRDNRPQSNSSTSDRPRQPPASPTSAG